MILIVDNYDSFTYNLVQYLETLGARCEVRLNDRTDPQAIGALQPDGILLSPGPGTPDDAGVTLAVIQALAGRVPILGVCLGHQCIGYAYGGRVDRAGEIKHGKSSLIHHDGKGIFYGLPNPFPAIRYHSLMVARENLPDCLEVTAWTEDNTIMGLRHHRYPVEGVQFHPESFMTQNGKDILKNFLAKEVARHD